MPAFILDNGSEPSALLGNVPTSPSRQRLVSLLPFFDFYGDIQVPEPGGLLSQWPGHRPMCLDEKLSRLPEGMTYMKLFSPNCPYVEAMHEMRHWFEEGMPGIDPQDTFMAPRFAEVRGNYEFVLTLNIFPGLPTPPDGTSVDTLLKFREKYTDEREQFWRSTIAIVDEFDFDNPGNHERNIRNSVRAAIEDFEKVSSENWLKRTVDRSALSFVPTRTAVLAIIAALASNGMIAQNLVDLPIEEIKSYLLASGWAGVALGTAACFQVDLKLMHSRPPMSQRAAAMSYLQRVKQL